MLCQHHDHILIITKPHHHFLLCKGVWDSIWPRIDPGPRSGLQKTAPGSTGSIFLNQWHHGTNRTGRATGATGPVGPRASTTGPRPEGPRPTERSQHSSAGMFSGHPKADGMDQKACRGAVLLHAWTETRQERNSDWSIDVGPTGASVNLFGSFSIAGTAPDSTGGEGALVSSVRSRPSRVPANGT